MERPYFPMFIDLTDKKILVAGGGTIALRRIRTLLKFRADIRVIAPELCEELAQLEEGGKIAAERREYCTPDIDGVQIVLAATDDHEVNRRIWEECRAAGVTVNVADDRSLCDFYFPSIVMTEDTVIGINCGGEDHAKVKETRIKIEEMFGE
ncbi:bifunctional precorrin-2 dehydrogenase/sirohydrochlorin ferrochelatase [Mediterraneibacter catenae]|uniref:precorrin-2 dehydrogenase n=1 Tax=Mediterraneibacter catenae TaxID=2594882 RepID=A0A5M9HYX3_9FIRM|nr:bifunctional precorrin-2 dehydrogenase/sirohydrochlorin ferrochelatase [Mediterraneibacter catenae]KAA8501833.1 bifunctional precorrin-2 dehydrogenase/sirohydrochlorin ferrochelatase [Mediterraneibacter catenae]